MRTVRSRRPARLTTRGFPPSPRSPVPGARRQRHHLQPFPAGSTRLFGIHFLHCQLEGSPVDSEQVAGSCTQGLECGWWCAGCLKRTFWDRDGEPWLSGRRGMPAVCLRGRNRTGASGSTVWTPWASGSRPGSQGLSGPGWWLLGEVQGMGARCLGTRDLELGKEVCQKGGWCEGPKGSGLRTAGGGGRSGGPSPWANS